MNTRGLAMRQEGEGETEDERSSHNPATLQGLGFLSFGFRVSRPLLTPRMRIWSWFMWEGDIFWAACLWNRER